jgi:hypothetical protein
MKWILAFFILGLAAPELPRAQDITNTNLLPNAASASRPVPNYQPITASERGHWFLTSTVGPTSLFLAGPLSAAIGTARDIPSEYGPHWDGFAKRNGMRLTGISTGNLIEAGLGAIWGEDPRYFPSPTRGVGPRVTYVIRTTFLAPHRDGSWHPAYARFAGDVGNNFLSNTWRADSEAKTSSAVYRSLWGMAGRMGSQAIAEFWPDVRKIAFRTK